MIPLNISNARDLLEFALEMIDEGDRPDEGGRAMLGNILKGLGELPDIQEQWPYLHALGRETEVGVPKEATQTA